MFYIYESIGLVFYPHVNLLDTFFLIELPRIRKKENLKKLFFENLRTKKPSKIQKAIQYKCYHQVILRSKKRFLFLHFFAVFMKSTPEHTLFIHLNLKYILEKV